MALSFNSINDALAGINTIENGETIKVAEQNLNGDAKNHIVELMEIAANRGITIKFEGEALQKQSRIQLFIVAVALFCLCMAPSLLQPLVNADGLSLLIIQGIWVLGLAKLGLLQRLGIRSANYKTKNQPV